jgi:hypothetical protein
MIHTVLTAVVQLDLLCVAHRTVDFTTPETHRVQIMTHIGVAFDARRSCVGGVHQFFRIDIKRDCLAFDFFLDCWIGMAGHAQCVREAFLVKNASDFVGLVAVDAAGNLMRSLFPQLSSDHLQMHLLNLRVALHACVCDVIPVDGGGGILMRQNIMGIVAARADCGHDQSPSEETVSMDRL